MADSSSLAPLKKAFEDAFEGLKREKVTDIVLYGKAGVGKTWMARKLSYRAINELHFDLALWLSLNKAYDSRSLLQSIARQISLLPVFDDWEFEEDAENSNPNDQDSDMKKEELTWDTVAKVLVDKKFLVILDDEGSHKTKADILKDLNGLAPRKFILTSTKDADWVKGTNTIAINVQSLCEDEARGLVEKHVGKIVDTSPAGRLVCKFLGKGKGYLPNEVIMMGKALSYYGKDESKLRALEKAVEENAEQYSILKLLSYGDEPFPRNILIDFFGTENYFLRERGSVYYSELINYWILEGYLGDYDSIDDAYNEGHSVLMELLDCGLLKQLEPGHVSLTEAKYQVNPLDYSDFVEKTHLGLGAVFDGELGRTAQAKGVVKGGGVKSVDLKKKVSTLMLDGDHLNHEAPRDLFRYRKDLEALAIFNPASQHLPLPLFEMEKLGLLVLRGCGPLESIEHILKMNSPENPTFVVLFNQLTVLEISGPSSLNKIPNDFFNHMPQIRSLNLSSLAIESLPSSLHDLKKLVWLILRECSNLKELPSLKQFSKLEVLDLSGASSLETIDDKSFTSNRELRILNLSRSQVFNLPVLRDLPKLTHLLLRDCDKLDRLRKVTALACLQILDLSGSKVFKEFVDPSFGKLSTLQVLDVSRTAVDKLPIDISFLCELRASHCSKLKELPFLEPIDGLEVLHLSGSSNLADIPNGFFSGKLKLLKELNLSNTNIKNLPSLSDLHNLKHFLLSHCTSLESLGELKSTTKLEILDLSGCKALKEIQGKSFDHMTRLQKLDLSETAITCLPILSSTHLRQLILKNCSNLENLPSLKQLSSLEELNLSRVRSIEEVVPDLEHMPNLDILDLSGTGVQKLPSLSNLKKIKYLSVGNCPSLTELPGLEALSDLNVLDLSGTAIKDLPSLESFSKLQRLLLGGCLSLEKFKPLEIHETSNATSEGLPQYIPKLTSLVQLEPSILRAGGHRPKNLKCLPEDPNQLPWSISNWSEKPVGSDKLVITLNSVEILQLLEENPTLWETSLSKFHFFVHPIEAFGKFGDKRFYRNELFLRDLCFGTERLRSLDIRGFDRFPRSLEPILVRAEFVFLADNPFFTCMSDLGVDRTKKMKACWIERCTEMENIFHEEEVKDVARSDERGKTDVVEENAVVMGNWECLETLSVSHAPKLKSICRGGGRWSSSFKNLRCFILEDCPQISAIFAANDQLGNLESLQIRFCSKVAALSEHDSAAFPKLHTLKLWGLPELKAITGFFPALQTLEIGECPELVEAFSPSQFPEGLNSLQIKFCDKLQTVFKSRIGTVVNLQRLCLWDLPELTNIGAHLPNPQNRDVRGCPKISTPKD